MPAWIVDEWYQRQDRNANEGECYYYRVQRVTEQKVIRLAGVRLLPARLRSVPMGTMATNQYAIMGHCITSYLPVAFAKIADGRASSWARFLELMHHCSRPARSRRREKDYEMESRSVGSPFEGRA
jgi:hypothetical protein